MTTPQSLRTDIIAMLGTDRPTTQQLWTLVKLSKYVRQRARSNIAFNNLFNQLFPHTKFQQITKQNADGSSYQGLMITVDGQSYNSSSTDDTD